METIGGSGVGADSTKRAGQSEEKLSGIIATKVVEVIREVTPELFGLVKTAMIELFNDRYAALSEVVVTAATMAVVVVGVRGERAFQYLYFDKTKPPELDGVKHPIIEMRWLYDMEGCFFTCSCLDDQKVKCTLNFLRVRVKDW